MLASTGVIGGEIGRNERILEPSRASSTVSKWEEMKLARTLRIAGGNIAYRGDIAYRGNI